MQYSERIRGLREDADLSQTELAQIFRVGQKTISNWENGRNEPPYEILKKYAEKFQVTTDYILGLTDDPNS